MELTKEETGQILTDFAKSFEFALGTDYTLTMLQALTKFATDCPETVQEIAALVIADPEMFAKLLTPAGVMEFKELIGVVKQFAPMFK